MTRVRFPDGVEGQRFFEKRAPKHTPDWVHTAPIEMGSVGVLDFIVCDDRPTLIWLAQLAGLELHPSLSLAKKPERPTVLAFDLDPGEPATAVECAQVALHAPRACSATSGWSASPSTRARRGSRSTCRSTRRSPSTQTKTYARAIAQALERSEPDLVVSKQDRKLRKGKVLVDWSQNDYSKTTVAVYSLRCRERPWVSIPLTWDEVAELADDGDPESVRFEAPQVLERVAEHGDLFAPGARAEAEAARAIGSPYAFNGERGLRWQTRHSNARGRPGRPATSTRSRSGSGRSATTWSSSGWAIQEGERVLDVACGTGNAAIPAAAAGGEVTGLDITPELFEDARRNAAGGAGSRSSGSRATPRTCRSRTGRFDVVVSTFGCMFAPDHKRAAGRDRAGAGARRPLRRRRLEPPRATSGKFFATIAKYAPPPPEGFQPPPLWGVRDHVDRDLRRHRRRARASRTPRCTGASIRLDEMVEEYATKFGPIVAPAPTPRGRGRLGRRSRAISRRSTRRSPTARTAASRSTAST